MAAEWMEALQPPAADFVVCAGLGARLAAACGGRRRPPVCARAILPRPGGPLVYVGDIFRKRRAETRIPAEIIVAPSGYD
jgi:hypothetical protein